MKFQALIVLDGVCIEGCSSATAALMAQPPPPHFCSTVVRLIALQILNTGVSYFFYQIFNGAIFNEHFFRKAIHWSKFVVEVQYFQHKKKQKICL